MSSFIVPKNQQLQIWVIAWPMIFANVATTLIGIVDTAILGHMNDPAFIGGAAVATSLFNIIYMSLAFLRMGTTGLVAQHFGEKAWQDLNNTLSLSGMIAVSIGIGLILFSPWVFSWAIPLIGGSPSVQDLALIYAEIRVLSSPFVLFNYVAVGFLIGVQQSRSALILLLVSQSINIFLDFYLAIHLNMGIAGIAWATAISDVAGTLVAIFFILRFFVSRPTYWLTMNNLKEKFLRIFDLNRDIFFRTIVLISIFAFITAQSARQGDLILAVNSILIQFFFFLANAVDGFANAAESKTGEYIGAQNRGFINNSGEKISAAFSAALQQSIVFLFVSLFLLKLFEDPLLSLISNIGDVQSTSSIFLDWLVLLLFCSVVCFVLDGVLIGATKGRAMLIAIASSTVLVFFPSWFLSRELGNHGLWFSLCLFMVFRSALTYFLYRNFKVLNWQN